VLVLGYEKLSSVFHLCPAIHSVADYKHLFAWLRNVFTVLAMMDYPYASQFLAPLPANPVNVSCVQLWHHLWTDVCYSFSTLVG